jgi:hypothetical protein
MLPHTPFFKTFNRLMGRRPKPAIDALLASLDADSLFGGWRVVFGNPMADKHFRGTRSGVGSRCRLLDMASTFWLWLEQVLRPDSSCRGILLKLSAAHASRPGDSPDRTPTESAYIQARQRLPVERIDAFWADLADQVEGATPAETRWCGRRVRVVDGSSVSMPDTPENQAQWPQPSEQKPGCGFPVLTFVGLIALESGAWLRTATGTLRDRESALLPAIWDSLEPGDILLGDRGFCSFSTMAHLASRGVDTVFRLHQQRPHDFRRGKRLGPHERLVCWTRPNPSASGCPPEVFALLPETLPVRIIRFRIREPGFRTREVYLATTLLDPELYPTEALAELYFQRWSIELRFREMKTFLGMDVLRCKSPAMIEKELAMHAIAYNLIRWLLVLAGVAGGHPPLTLSFKAGLDAVPCFLDAMHAHSGKPRHQRRIFQQLIGTLSVQILPERPGRAEPRAKKRRPKNYQLLTKPRHRMPTRGHRNRPTKPRIIKAKCLS